MAEQLICNQQVDGSTPFTSSIHGSVPERPKGADCKSVVSDFGGPNPPAPTKKTIAIAIAFLFTKHGNVFCWRRALLNEPIIFGSIIYESIERNF